uniref:Uncharacterized protein n=1 Tax=viral metagenome TaxID=1070528 RepID=A0A6M3JKZ9_9ZZZZ
MTYISWIQAHWVELVAAIGGIVTTASVIVKLTPTPKDDAALAWVMKIFNMLALNPKVPPK